MKKMLLILTLCLAFYSRLFSQNCAASDLCSKALKVNLNGFITSTEGYTNGTEPISCPNGQAWGVHNDLWVAFVPKQSTLEINVDVIGNCSSGETVQALIHDNCATDPIDCDVDCGGYPSVGGAITFIPGKTYYLRIDGCSGSVCSVQISVNPSNAIETQFDTLNSNLSDISGLNTITCSGDKIYTYCTTPINDCSKDYNWKIESGNALIDNSGGQIIDNDPSNPGKNIIKTGIGRNCVNLKFKGSGPVKLSVIGSDGINYTNKVSKTIEVIQSTIDSININICPNQFVYENDTLPGGPFPPGYPCGTKETYTIEKINNLGCPYNILLSITQFCDSILNLGEIALCPNEKFRVGDFEFDSTAVGPQKVTCKVKPSQNANLNPPQCDTIKTFIISKIKINPIIFPEKYTLPCVDSKITLNAKSSNWYPIDTALLKSISFKWQDYTPAPGNGWQVIPDATQDTLLVDKPGRYRLITTLEVKYKDGFGNIKVKTCSKTSNIILVSPLGTNSLETPDYQLVNSFCIGKPYSLNIINPDPNLIYNWVKIPQNDTTSSTSFSLDMNNPYQIVCLQSKSLCGLNSITMCDTIFNKSELPIDENISIQGFNSGCSGKEIGLKLLNNNNYLINVLHSYKDTINSRIEKDSIFLKFKYAGTYQIQFEVSNACNAKTISKQFIIDQSVPKISIRGPKTAIEKTTQIYCINNPNNNAIIWTTSKNLKYKVSSTNKQSCIYVTFPKGINVGWIKSTISNNCSSESDSILIVSKPKFGNSEIEQLNEDSKNINDRATQSEEIEFSVFPNPATNTIEVKGNQPFDQIEILDILGKSKLIDNISNKFDISELNTGFYILKIISNKKVLAKNTFIKID